MIYKVQRSSQYKLGNAPMEKDGSPVYFNTRQEADLYALKADSGIGGDMRYRYKVSEENRTVQPMRPDLQLDILNENNEYLINL